MTATIFEIRLAWPLRCLSHAALGHCELLKDGVEGGDTVVLGVYSDVLFGIESLRVTAEVTSVKPAKLMILLLLVRIRVVIEGQSVPSVDVLMMIID